MTGKLGCQIYVPVSAKWARNVDSDDIVVAFLASVDRHQRYVEGASSDAARND